MKIKNEKELIRILKKDIDNTDKKRIVFLAGHFPLVYTSAGAIEAIHKWGSFSIYSLELGCELAKYAREIGKEIKYNTTKKSTLEINVEINLKILELLNQIRQFLRTLFYSCKLTLVSLIFCFKHFFV